VNIIESIQDVITEIGGEKSKLWKGLQKVRNKSEKKAHKASTSLVNNSQKDQAAFKSIGSKPTKLNKLMNTPRINRFMKDSAASRVYGQHAERADSLALAAKYKHGSPQRAFAMNDAKANRPMRGKDNKPSYGLR